MSETSHTELHRGSDVVEQRSDRGASVVEYALLVALIMLVAFIAVQFLGAESSASFSESAESVDSAVS